MKDIDMLEKLLANDHLYLNRELSRYLDTLATFVEFCFGTNFKSVKHLKY